ncbi:871_t:CDS:2 [Paraglomus brasilianum]|uniref:871_t:CDS:1 n=1 Tax=Paraglomus brasilianum TaxID=144538 RepID=A0A9N9F0K0_9GLOM|nr:871_t:CDS:2 [Paraglomus brasilianum]
MAIDDFGNRNRRNRKLPPLRRIGRNQLQSGGPKRTGRVRSTPYDRSRPPRGDINGQWSHDLFEDGTENPRRSSAISKRLTFNQNGNPRLVVENLFYEVTQDDLQELFSEYGSIKKIYLHYDRAGRSTGVADITFENSGDAATALDKLNGVELDGQKMHIKFAALKPGLKVSNGRSSNSSSWSASVFDRLGDSRGSSIKQGSSNIRSRIGHTKTDSNSASNSGSRLSGRVRERARDTSNQDNDRRKTPSLRKVITYDELDADLDAYMAIDVSIT